MEYPNQVNQPVEMQTVRFDMNRYGRTKLDGTDLARYNTTGRLVVLFLFTKN